MSIPKTHGHVVITKLNVKHGLMVPKSIRLHSRNSSNYTHEKHLFHIIRKKCYTMKKLALQYLMFLKEKRDGTQKHEFVQMEDP